MAILPSMTLEQPTVGGSRGQWGGIDNGNWAKIDGHTHVTGQGEPIPVAGLDIDADLSFGSLFGPKDLHAITFASIVALSSNTYNKSLFVSDGTGGLSANELYWRNSSGNHVKLTAGNSLNVAAFVGGIVGDYTAIGAAEAFDNADKDYTFKDGAGKWAGIRGGTLVLSPKGGTSTFRVTLQPPAGLATTYAVTWPGAVPAAAAVMQMSTTGVLSTSATLPAGVILPADAEIHHGTHKLQLSSQSGTALEAHWVNDPVGGNFKNSVGNGRLIVGIPLDVGDRITGASFLLFGNGVADVTVTLAFNDSAMNPGTMASLTVNNQAASWSAQPMTVTPHTLLADECFYLIFLSSATGLQLGNITITYTRP